MPRDRAREFVAQVELAATRLAEGAIRKTQVDLRKQGYDLTCFGPPLAAKTPVVVEVKV